MRIVSLIDDRAVIERILRHLGLWQQGVRVSPSTGPPVEIVDRVIPPSPVGYGGQAEPCFDLSRRSQAKADDPFPDYDTEPLMAYANG